MLKTPEEATPENYFSREMNESNKHDVMDWMKSKLPVYLFCSLLLARVSPPINPHCLE